MNGLPNCFPAIKDEFMRRVSFFPASTSGRSLTLPVLIWAFLACAGTTWGQPPAGNNLPNPKLLTLTPCGAKAGTTVEVTFSGTDLEEPQSLLFSHPGITPEPIIPPPPQAPTPDPKKAPPKPDPKQPAPKPAPTAKFKVTISA